MNTIKYTYVQKDEDMIVCSVVAAAHQQNTWTNTNKKLRWTLSNTHMPIQMMTRSYAVSLLQHVSKTRKQTQTKNNDEHYQIYIFRLKGWYIIVCRWRRWYDRILCLRWQFFSFLTLHNCFFDMWSLGRWIFSFLIIARCCDI